MVNTKLKPCVDCGKNLSVTATNCQDCNSTDPFGRSRAQRSLEGKIIFSIIIIIILFVASIYFHIIPDDYIPVNLLNIYHRIG